MAIYDYLSATPATPDNNETLNTPRPQVSLVEKGVRNQIIHVADDNSEARISLSDDNIFFLTLQWAALSQTDIDILEDFYFNPLKGDARAKSFIYTHVDGYNYTVRWDSDWSKTSYPTYNSLRSMTMKILGRAP